MAGFVLLPFALSPCSQWPYMETVVSSFHATCWCFNNSWLRIKGTTSNSSFGITVRRLVSFHFSTARDLQIYAGVPIYLQHSLHHKGTEALFLYQRQAKSQRTSQLMAKIELARFFPLVSIDSKQAISHILQEAACSGRWSTTQPKGLIPLRRIESCCSGKSKVKKVKIPTTNTKQDPGYILPVELRTDPYFNQK